VLQELTTRLVELLANHPGKVLGVVLGLFVGLLVIIFGVLRTVFLIACVLVGLYFGARVDESEHGTGPSATWRRIKRFGKRA
jgi:uncharacterized membrane protein